MPGKAFSIFDVFVLLGIIQGLICSMLLWRTHIASKKILALVLITFSLLSFKILLHTFGLWDTPVFRYFPLAIDLLIQPLLFIYTLSLTKSGSKFDRKLWLHFLPCVAFMVHAIVVYTCCLSTNQIPIKDHIADQFYFNPVKQFEDYLSVISAVVYWYLSYREIIYYRRWLFDHSADEAIPTYNWLKNLLFLLGVFIAGLFFNILLDSLFHYNAAHFFHWQVFYVYIVVLVYYLGFTGYFSKSPEKFLDNLASKERTIESSGFSEKEMALAQNSIIVALEKDKVFIDPELNLNTFAAKLGLSENLVSVTINKNLGKNFRNLVNEYRVNEVRKKIIDPKYQHLSIFGIALESGFNSEPSFYRAFKKFTEMSPKEYLKRIDVK